MSRNHRTIIRRRAFRPAIVGGVLVAALLGLGLLGAVNASDSETDVELPMYIASRMGSATPDQLALISDEALTRAEYQFAYESYGACAEDAGASIAKPATWSDDIGDFELWVEISGGPTAASIEAGVDRCWKDHVGIIQDYWHWQRDGRPSETDLANERIETHRNILDCLKASGFEVGVGSPEDLNQAMEQDRAGFKKCVEDAQP